ncbi:MAG: hypothetical protein Q4D54_01960 [Eubacteriales bacterium]|nr:hypothetical protein [Eubacteriales bacterium]
MKNGLLWGVIARIPPIEDLPNLFQKYRLICNLGDGDRGVGISVLMNELETNANYTNNQINKTAADFFRSLLLSSNEFIEM